MNNPTQKQLKYCRDIHTRIGSAPCDKYGEPLYEKSFNNADAYIKANKNSNARWSDQEQKEFEDRNHPSDWGVPNH